MRKTRTTMMMRTRTKMKKNEGSKGRRIRIASKVVQFFLQRSFLFEFTMVRFFMFEGCEMIGLNRTRRDP